MKTPDLRSQREVATEIGLLVMYSANLDIMFVDIVSELLGGDRDAAFTIAKEVNNLSAKMAIMFNVAELNKGASFADAVLAEKTHVLRAIAYRNKLVHGLYVFDRETGNFELFSNLLSNRRGKPKCEPLRPKVIVAYREYLRVAIGRILEAGGDRLVAPLSAP